LTAAATTDTAKVCVTKSNENNKSDVMVYSCDGVAQMDCVNTANIAFTESQ